MDTFCPYCAKGIEIYHDDGRGYEEDVAHHQQCPNCDKSFIFFTSISFNYQSEQADCLNDGNHDWELTHTTPKEFSKMQCRLCTERRELTDEERKEHNIGTKSDYFKQLNAE